MSDAKYILTRNQVLKLAKRGTEADTWAKFTALTLETFNKKADVLLYGYLTVEGICDGITRIREYRFDVKKPGGRLLKTILNPLTMGESFLIKIE